MKLKDLNYYMDYKSYIKNTYDILLDIKTIGFTEIPNTAIQGIHTNYLITFYDEDYAYLGKITFFDIKERDEADIFLCELIDYKGL